MRKVIIVIFCILPSIGMAQSEGYEAFIYTSEELTNEINSGMEEERGLLGDLFDAGIQSVKKIGLGYASSLATVGTDVLKSLLTRNAQLKQHWEETVRAENVFTTTITTVQGINNFYKEKSYSGALDPKGLYFDGIGCLRKEGTDTVFYISCHIDRSKINRILDHSKFELTIDTLIISPFHSNLPNSSSDIPFSFEERKDFVFSMNIKITSSWINELTQLYKDQELGEFAITIPVNQDSLDSKGFLRYVRKENKSSNYAISGESFIVPRSFMGYRDATGNYKNCWGTGEYQLSIELKETCDITEEYRSSWKQDWKRRKANYPKEGFFSKCWHTLTNQSWDDSSKTWVISTQKTSSEPTSLK